MKKLVGIVVLFVALFSQHSQAAKPEILWFKLEKSFTYKDIDRYCSTEFSPSSFLMAVEVLDGIVKGALFKTNNSDFMAHKLPFTAAELLGVRFKVDSSGRKWLESMKLSARQLNWIFTRGSGMDCIPTQPLATLGPNEFTYSFDLETILINPAEVLSILGQFSGQRKDGRYYQISLSMVQQRMP